MNEIKSLEFDIIRSTLTRYASMNLNKEKFNSLELIRDFNKLQIELNKTDEASKILKRYGRIVIEELNNIYLSVDKASKGAILGIDELYDIKSSFRVIKENLNFSKSINKEEFKEYFNLVNYLNMCPELDNSLIKVISDKGQINDDASSKLKKIRKEIKNLEIEIKNKLLSLISTYSSILSDTSIVYKNGKQVLAVQSIHKYKLGGIIVDESNSGYTSYVEPEAVYKITSKINILKNEESEEIQRILMELSMMVNKYENEIRTNFECLLELDFMFAKGEYGNNLNAKIATLSESTIKLTKARHPLIEKDKVVSNDFYLSDDDKKILIISGPNTGGKSVALKTVGLLAYMNQCGLAVPIDNEAILPVFDNIYVDIGDNQSITSSLSTFSSHISNISYILKNITNKSLVLLDEVGAGTDPKEGEALAMAIIDYCHQKGCYLLSSTHYENLKTFALNQDYIDVSSMEFDKKNLKPTYKLLKNQIGKSYALEISSRYGIDKKIIDNAYKYKEEYSTSNELTLQKLELKLEEQQQIIKNYQMKKDELNTLINANKEKEQDLANEIERIKEEAESEIDNLIKEKKEEIKEILKSVKNKDNVKMHELLIANKKLDDLVVDKQEDNIINTFNINDEVNIISLNKKGIIISVNKNKYGVNIGNLTLNVEGNDLEKTRIEKKKNKVVISNKTKTSKMSIELNLIGKRVEEALILLDNYLDKARLVNLPFVRVIHGYGTGKLQKAIHEYLKKEKNIEYRFGGELDGGMGSTIIEFKKKVN